MKNSSRLKIVAGFMLLYGVLAMTTVLLIVKGRIPAGPHYRNFLISENLFLGAGNIILGLGLLKPAKWAVVGTVIFGAFAFFLYLAKITFFGGYHFIVLQIFYAFVVYFSLLALKEIQKSR